MPENKEIAQTTALDPIAQRALLNLGVLLRSMDLSPNNVRSISVSVSPSGRFALGAQTKEGAEKWFEGGFVAGTMQGTIVDSPTLRNATTYEFWMAKANTGKIERTLSLAAGGLGVVPQQGTFLNADFTEQSGSIEVKYKIKEQNSLSGGTGRELTIAYPWHQEDGTGTKDGAILSLPLASDMSVDKTKGQQWENLFGQAKLRRNYGWINAGEKKIDLFASYDKPYGQQADIVTLWREPVTAFVWQETESLEIMCDKSDTFSPHLPLAEQTALQVKEWFVRSRGADAPQPSIAYLKDDKATNQANYAVIDAHKDEFERYFRLRFKDEAVDRFLRNKEDYQQGRTQDQDGFALGINEYIDQYEHAVAMGRAPPGDLVLMGDGGNQYRRLVYDKNAGSGQIWTWQFDEERFENDKSKVKEFHLRHPQARIHFFYRKYAGNEADLHPLDAPSDWAQIADLASLTGGKSAEMGENFSPPQAFPLPKPLVLLPKFGIAHLGIEPVNVSPFLSAEGGTRTLANPPFWNTTLPRHSMGRPVDLKGLMLTGKTGYEDMDKDREHRFEETAPSVGGGLLRWLGIKDINNAVGFSYFMDKYDGMNAVGKWSDAIYDYVRKNKLSEKEQKKTIEDNLALNLDEMCRNTWPTGQDEFEKFGATGAALGELNRYLVQVQYYQNLKNKFKSESGLQKFSEKKYADLIEVGLGHYTKPLMRDKTMVGLYESMAWNSLQSLAFVEGGAGAYFKGYLHFGETGSANPNVRAYGERHPAMTLWTGIAYDPFVRPAGEQGFYMQLKDFVGTYTGLTLNKPLMRNPKFPIDLRFELAAGVIAPVSEQAGLELSSVGLLGDGYVGRWPLTQASPIGALRASLFGSYLPENDAYEFNWRVSIDGLPTAAALFLKDHKYGLFGPDANTRERIYDVNPALQNIVPPNTIAANLRVPIWNKLNDVTGAMVEGLFSGQVVSSGFMVKELGLKTSITPVEGYPTLELSAGGEGFVGMSSFLATAALKKSFGKLETSLEYQFKKYPGKSLNYVAFEMKFEL